MRKRKIILAVAALTLGTSSAFAMMSMAEYKLRHEPTTTCEKVIENLALRYAIDKTLTERMKHRKMAGITCGNTKDSHQLESNSHYFRMYAPLPY